MVDLTELGHRAREASLVPVEFQPRVEYKARAACKVRVVRVRLAERKRRAGCKVLEAPRTTMAVRMPLPVALRSFRYR